MIDTCRMILMRNMSGIHMVKLLRMMLLLMMMMLVMLVRMLMMMMVMLVRRWCSVYVGCWVTVHQHLCSIPHRSTEGGLLEEDQILHVNKVTCNVYYYLSLNIFDSFS